MGLILASVSCAELEAPDPVYLRIPGFVQLEFSGCAPAEEAGHFIVCSDENKKVVWKIDASTGKSVSFAWSAKGVDDMEGLASDGRGELYALASQSLNSGGLVKKSRTRLVSIVLKKSEGRLRGIIDNFRGELLDTYTWLQAYEAGRPKKGGIDVEGIAYDGSGDRMWIGFRGPLVSADDSAKPGDRAILLQLNAVSKGWRSRVLSAGDWDKGNPILLDLGGHGVRDLYYDGKHQLYILSGKLGPDEAEDGGKPKLWRYDVKQKRLKIVGDIPKVPANPGDMSTLVAPEGVCAIRIAGQKKLVVVYDSARIGIYTVSDFPSD
jgi:hypothetical protein